MPTEQLKSLSAPISPEVARDLVARLSDSEVRQLLLERLDALAAERAPQGLGLQGAVVALERNAGRIRDRLRAMIVAIVDLPQALGAASDRFLDGRPPSILFKIGLLFAAMMAVGWLVERTFRHLTRAARTGLDSAQPDGLGARLGYLGLRLGLDVAAIGLFVLAAVGLFFVFYQGHEATRMVVMAYVAAIGLVRLFATVSRFLLAPKRPPLRLMTIGDHDARFFHRQGVVVAVVAAFGFLTCSLLQFLGADADVYRLLVTLVGVVVTALIAYTLWRGRRGIAGDLRATGGEVGQLRSILAAAWPFVALSFVVAFYGVVLLLALAGVGVSYIGALATLVVVLLLPHVDAMLERAANGVMRRGHGGEFQVVILRAGRIALAVLAVLFVLRAWALNLFSLAEQSFGTRLAGALFDVGLTLLVAYMLWEIARITIDRRIAEEMAEEAAEVEGGDEGGTGLSRLATLLPLIRVTLKVAVITIAAMLILSALGVSIGPLLAGAGIVGIAVGFGAQTLVRDIVSGAFFLLDDAFRIGEYIDIGDVKGVVEKISVRSLRLRHHLGPLHTVPFGEIRHLTNMSRDWVIMKLEFRVTYDTDINKVKKLFKQIGQEVLADPVLGPGFIEPFKSQGVKAMEDSAIVVRGKFMAKPGQQFMIRKEIYNRVQKAFNENGIKFAHRRVAIDLPAGVAPDSDQGKALTEAAAAAAGLESEPGKA